MLITLQSAWNDTTFDKRIAKEKENLRPLDETRDSILTWSRRRGGQEHHILRSKSGIYSILYYGSRWWGSRSKWYSRYYLGFCQNGEFRLEGMPQLGRVTRIADDLLVAEWSDLTIQFNDSRKSTFKRVLGNGVMPFRRIRTSQRFDYFFDNRNVEQMRIESDGLDRRLYVSPDADLDCLPVLVMLSRHIQLKQAEFSTYTATGP